MLKNSLNLINDMFFIKLKWFPFFFGLAGLDFEFECLQLQYNQNKLILNPVIG